MGTGTGMGKGAGGRMTTESSESGSSSQGISQMVGDIDWPPVLNNRYKVYLQGAALQ